jgi:hypothetical protein
MLDISMGALGQLAGRLETLSLSLDMRLLPLEPATTLVPPSNTVAPAAAHLDALTLLVDVPGMVTVSLDRLCGPNVEGMVRSLLVSGPMPVEHRRRAAPGTLAGPAPGQLGC